jgi:predicted metal-dependent peptidase
MSNTALKAQVSDTQARMLSDQWKLRLDKEIAAIKMSGSAIPGFLKQLSSIMHVEEKVDWRSQFESYAMDIYKTVYRMNPPNKRSYHLGVIMPSIRGEHIEVAVVVDTSYSQLAYIKKIYAELQHIFAAFDSYKIVVIECDSQVNAVYEYNTGEDFGDLQPEAAGGGGTDFRPAFEYVEQNHPETNLMVFATDGYGSFPTEEPPYNVIWLTAPNTLPISSYPFGTAIVVDDLMETEET